MVNRRSTITPSVVGMPWCSELWRQAGGLLGDRAGQAGRDGVRPRVARIAGGSHVGTGVQERGEVDEPVAVVVVLAEVDVRIGLRHGLHGHADRAAASG